MKIKELLSDENKWTTGAMARDIDLEPVSPHNETAVCWCILGAIVKCYKIEDRNEIIQKLYLTIDPGPSLNPDDRSLGVWNDNHSFEAVKNLVNKLNI